MITVEQTTDAEYIKSVLTKPEIFASISDDSRKDSSVLDFDAAMRMPGYFLRVIVDGVSGGLFWLLRKGDLIEAHTALLENCRGRNAIIATKLGIRWVFEKTDASGVVSYAWSDCPAVAWFCRAVGMRPGKTEAWPNTRGGKPVEITWFTLNRKEFS